MACMPRQQQDDLISISDCLISSSSRGLMANCFIGTSKSCQAFVVTVQGPDIVGVLGTTWQSIANSKIVLVMDYRLFNPPLFEQQRPECMPRRMHPWPGFRVLEMIAEHTCLT